MPKKVLSYFVIRIIYNMDMSITSQSLYIYNILKMLSHGGTIFNYKNNLKKFSNIANIVKILYLILSYEYLHFERSIEV